MERIKLYLRNERVTEFIRFCIVGLGNTAINYSIYTVLLLIMEIYYLVAGSIGFMAGAFTGFIFNRLWTFKSYVAIGSGSGKYFIIQF